MSALPRVQHVTRVVAVKKSLVPLVILPREKKHISHAVREDWRETMQSPNASLRDALVVPVISPRQQQGSGDSDPKDDDSKRNGGSTDVVLQQVETSLPLNMNRLGGLIAAFVVHSVVHGSWSVRIPLSHELLQETVLHMRCEQAVLTLRFETSDWSSRETLMRHAPTLLQRLHQSLPQLADVVLLTD